MNQLGHAHRKGAQHMFDTALSWICERLVNALRQRVLQIPSGERVGGEQREA